MPDEVRQALAYLFSNRQRKQRQVLYSCAMNCIGLLFVQEKEDQPRHDQRG